MQVMIDHANEEQDVRDLSNFLALLLRGAEVSTGKSFRLILTLLILVSALPHISISLTFFLQLSSFL
jgi:hypothetical protein